jgi:C4-dicarboxylate-specific signal transduction histidine kinase
VPEYVVMDLDIKGASVYGVHSDFARLLRTMAMNAAPGQGPAPPRFRAWCEGGSVCLEMADQAGAMPQAALERAFEPFHAEPEPGARAPHPALVACRQILTTYGGSLEMRNAGDGVALKATIAVGEN